MKVGAFGARAMASARPLKNVHLSKVSLGFEGSDRFQWGRGEVAEWLKAPLSKSGILPKAGSWVRIPPSPPGKSKYVRLSRRSGRGSPDGIARGFVCSEDFGEMSELAEGARLEIVCTAKSGTEGSNPSLSAIKYRI
jgi:hypothetical protein